MPRFASTAVYRHGQPVGCYDPAAELVAELDTPHPDGSAEFRHELLLSPNSGAWFLASTCYEPSLGEEPHEYPLEYLYPQEAGRWMADHNIRPPAHLFPLLGWSNFAASAPQAQVPLPSASGFAAAPPAPAAPAAGHPAPTGTGHTAPEPAHAVPVVVPTAAVVAPPLVPPVTNDADRGNGKGGGVGTAGRDDRDRVGNTPSADGFDRLPRPHSTPKLAPSRAKPLGQWLEARRQNPEWGEEPDLRTVYDWVKEQPECEPLKSFPTWCTYLKQARKQMGASRRTPKADRPTGKSVVCRSDI